MNTFASRLALIGTPVLFLFGVPVLANAQTYAHSGGPFTTQSACWADMQAWQIAEGKTTPSGQPVVLDNRQFYCSCQYTVSDAAQTANCPSWNDPSKANQYAWDAKFLPVYAAPAGSGSPGGQINGSGSPGGQSGSGSGSPGGQSGSGSGSIGGQQNTGLINPLSAGTDLEKLLADILKLIVRIGTIVIILMLVYIGYLFATTSIEPDNKNRAKEALLWTVVGALILLGAQAIASGIEATVQAISAGG